MKLAVCLGRTGDLINILPACKHLGIDNILVRPEYVNVLRGASYIIPNVWEGDIEDLASAVNHAKTIADKVYVPQLFGSKQPPGMPERKRVSFVQDQWDRLEPGLGDRWGQFPLVFDCRDKEREKELLRHVIGTKVKPVLLFNLKGKSSPYPHTDAMMYFLKISCRDFELVNLSYLRTDYFYDLLALYENAAGMITTDTATLHLARACPQLPVFQLRRDGTDGTLPMGRITQSYSHETFENMNVFFSTLMKTEKGE